MKHNIKIFCNVLMVLVTSFSHGQEELSDKQLIGLKDKVEETAKNTTSIKSDFIQEKHLSVLNNIITSEGRMVFKAPDKIRWEYSKPYSNVSVFKDDLLFVMDEGKKVTIDLKSNKIFRSLHKLIVDSIKGDMFDDDQFHISYYLETDNYLVRFVPKDKRIKKMIESFELKFNKDSAQVVEVKMIERNADFTLIKFSNRKTNEMVGSKSFEL